MKRSISIIIMLFLIQIVFIVSCVQPPPPDGILQSSACAITSPPADMEGINTQTDMYGTGADPGIITLGPTTGGRPGWEPYAGKISMEFELAHGTPILAPIDMTFIGFNNRNAQQRDGVSPYNDLLLCFESASDEWPGLIISMYHLYTSPLLPGHYVDPGCGEIEEWGKSVQAQGRVFYEYNEEVYRQSASSCKCLPLLGKTVKRGELIGYAGSVGGHSMLSFCSKVQHNELNPQVRSGNRYLHWVQPGSFFYWKCYGPEVSFPAGVLAYPFECSDFQLPAEQRQVTFKYTADS